jgi:hypothetical protein
MHDQPQIGMIVNAKLIEAPEVERAGATIGPDDVIAFVEKEPGEVGAVLAGNARDQSNSHIKLPRVVDQAA